MNYLLSFAHLLKWLFCPAPKPSMAGVADAFVAAPHDNGRIWEEMRADMLSAVTVEASQVPLNTSRPLVDENDIQSASVVVPPMRVESAATTTVEPDEVELPDETMSQRPAGWITVQLQQQVTLANLAELHQELQQLLGKRVQLSGSQVQRVDTAALQLLVAFMHSAEVSVCWIDHSPALRQAARLLGLSTLLNLPE